MPISLSPSRKTSQPTPPSPSPSALTSLLFQSTTANSTISNTPLSAATLQILHNLQLQHLWTSLQIHRLSLPGPSSPSSSSSPSPSPSQEPAFITSGIPPTRTYTHPDEQLFMLERGLREDDIDPERTFVLPSVQGQSWSLRRMAAVFDSLPRTDEDLASLAENPVVEDPRAENEEKDGDGEKDTKVAEYLEYRRKAKLTKEWGGKRLLLAMVDRGMGGEGTVVYYVVQEGAVKPRQN